MAELFERSSIFLYENPLKKEVSPDGVIVIADRTDYKNKSRLNGFFYFYKVFIAPLYRGMANNRRIDKSVFLEKKVI